MVIITPRSWDLGTVSFIQSTLTIHWSLILRISQRRRWQEMDNTSILHLAMDQGTALASALLCCRQKLPFLGCLPSMNCAPATKLLKNWYMTLKFSFHLHPLGAFGFKLKKGALRKQDANQNNSSVARFGGTCIYFGDSQKYVKIWTSELNPGLRS